MLLVRRQWYECEHQSGVQFALCYHQVCPSPCVPKSDWITFLLTSVDPGTFFDRRPRFYCKCLGAVIWCSCSKGFAITWSNEPNKGVNAPEVTLWLMRTSPYMILGPCQTINIGLCCKAFSQQKIFRTFLELIWPLLTLAKILSWNAKLLNYWIGIVYSWPRKQQLSMSTQGPPTGLLWSFRLDCMVSSRVSFLSCRRSVPWLWTP